MYCRKCGAPLPEDAIYCGNCGEKIINGCAIKKTQSNKMYIIIAVLFLVITTIGYIFTQVDSDNKSSMTTYSGSVDSNFIPVEINPDVKVTWYDSKDKLTKKYPKLSFKDYGPYVYIWENFSQNCFGNVVDKTLIGTDSSGHLKYLSINFEIDNGTYPKDYLSTLENKFSYSEYLAKKARYENDIIYINNSRLKKMMVSLKKIYGEPDETIFEKATDKYKTEKMIYKWLKEDTEIICKFSYLRTISVSDFSLTFNKREKNR